MSNDIAYSKCVLGGLNCWFNVHRMGTIRIRMNKLVFHANTLRMHELLVYSIYITCHIKLSVAIRNWSGSGAQLEEKTVLVIRTK